jgi:hypothetical protein
MSWSAGLGRIMQLSREREDDVMSGDEHLRPVSCPTCSEPVSWTASPCPACGTELTVSDFARAMALIESGLLDDIPILEDTGVLS